MTLDKAKVSLMNIWEPGQAYVALSRVRSLDGLQLENFSKNVVIVDSDVYNWAKKMFPKNATYQRRCPANCR